MTSCSPAASSGGASATTSSGADRLERIHHALADAASRNVDDAAQADIVVRVDDQLEVGQRVLDFFALVEPDAADDLVGNAVAHQRVFNRARLGVGAVEDGDHRVDVAGAGLFDRPRDEVRLLELVVAPVIDDPRTALAIGPQPLVLAVPVLADHRGSRVQDHLRRAVVLFQLDDFGFGKVVLEIEDVLQVGAAPFIDGLIGVANHRQVPVDLGQPLDQQVLGTVRVLVFVDHHEPELVCVIAAGRLRGLEELDGFQQQVVEVQGVGVLQRLQVSLVDLGNLLVAKVPLAAQRVRPFHPVPGVADPRQRHARRDQLVVDPELALCLLDDRDLIGRVVNHEITRQPDLRRFPPQQPRAQRVERGEPDPAGIGSDQPLDPLPHLLRRLVGERHRKDLVGPGVPAPDEIGDPIGDDPRLA